MSMCALGFSSGDLQERDRPGSESCLPAQDLQMESKSFHCENMQLHLVFPLVGGLRVASVASKEHRGACYSETFLSLPILPSCLSPLEADPEES